MKNKKNLYYAIIIVALAVILGVLWFLIIDDLSANYIADNDNTPAMNGDSSSASYSAVKEITTDEDIDGGEFSSTNADENAISASGDITVTLSNIDEIGRAHV